MSWNVRIGINPLSWINDDLPSLGAGTALDSILREGAQIGYAGFELGSSFPKDPMVLQRRLAEHGLACVSGWYSGTLATGQLDSEIENCEAHMEKLRLNGCDVVVYGEVAGSIQGQRGTALNRRPSFLHDGQWKEYARKLNAFGEHLSVKHGITLAYHHHMGAYVETPRDVDTLMALTDPACVGLLFDTGHAFFGGAEKPADLLRRHVHRVVHVHCKDVRVDMVRRARNDGWSFLDSVLNGAFTVPGDGGIDFEEVLTVLHDGGYQGWLVVEAEQDPAVAPSYRYAKKGFETLRDIVARLNARTAEVA
jgi:inosose dehydratase